MEELREHIRTVTTKGQVTLPVEVRRLLKVKPQDKVVFRIVEDRVELSRVPMTLEEAFGSVAPLKRPEDFGEIRAIVADERAERWSQGESR
jgi:AbrB family looped-hinge helix DNA binding protein